MRVVLLSCVIVGSFLNVAHGVKCRFGVNVDEKAELRQIDCPNTNYCLTFGAANGTDALYHCGDFVLPPSATFGLNFIDLQEFENLMMALRKRFEVVSGSNSCSSVINKTSRNKIDGTIRAVCCDQELCNARNALSNTSENSTVQPVSSGIQCYEGLKGNMKERYCPNTNYCLIVTDEDASSNQCGNPEEAPLEVRLREDILLDLSARKQNEKNVEWLSQAYFLRVTGERECKSVLNEKKDVDFTFDSQEITGTVHVACCDKPLCNSTLTVFPHLIFEVVFLLVFLLQ